MNNIEDNNHIQHQLAVAAGLNQLRLTNRWGLQPLTDAQIQSPLVEEYIQRNLDEDTEADIRTENAIKEAVYLSVKRSKWKPRKSAKLLANIAVEELRAARLTTLFHDQRIDAMTYREECENNYVQNALAVARRIKKRYGRKIIKSALTIGLYVAGAPYAALTAGGVMLAHALIPKKYKEKIKKKTREVATRAIETIRSGLQRLKEKGRQVAQRAQSALTRTLETAQRIAKPVIEAAHTVAANIKKKVDRAKEKVKSVWHSLFG